MNREIKFRAWDIKNKRTLQISEKALDRLLKTIPKAKDKYIREDVIRAVMGGRIICE